MPASSPARLAILSLSAAALAFTAGCAGGGKLKDTAYVARDVDKL